MAFLSLTILILILGSVLVYQKAFATPPTGGITSTTLASVKLPNPVKVKIKEDDSGFGKSTTVSQVVVAQFSAPAGAHFGWHQHSGPIWVILTKGSLTYYVGNGSKCVKETYSAGTAFLDPGNDTHTAINEGSETAELYAVYMLPEGGAARIDMPNPGVCPGK
jgi:quercetin dioxygenase-like cupin family protein